MIINEATYSSEQLAACYQLDFQMMKAPWPLHHWLALKQDHKGYLLQTAFEGNQLVGLSLWKTDVIDQFAHLLKIIIHHDAQGMGRGGDFLEQDLEHLQQWGICKFYLEVDEENDAAVHLYRKFGFKQVNRIEKFYSDGGNALILYKEV